MPEREIAYKAIIPVITRNGSRTSGTVYFFPGQYYSTSEVYQFMQAMTQETQEKLRQHLGPGVKMNPKSRISLERVEVIMTRRVASRLMYLPTPVNQI